MILSTLTCGHRAARLNDGTCGWCTAERERDALAARVDELEALLVDATHAREQAESAIPAGVAVLERDALRAHVERLRGALEEYDRHTVEMEKAVVVPQPEFLGRNFFDGRSPWSGVRERARVALAATPASPENSEEPCDGPFDHVERAGVSDKAPGDER